MFEITDAGLKRADLGTSLVESGTQRVGDRALGILDQSADARDDLSRADGDDEAEFAQKAARGVDPRGALGQVGGAVAVEGCEDMLVDGFDGNGMDVLVAVGFEQPLGVGAIGFVATDVAAHDVRGQEDDIVSEASELSGPVMRGAASFEEDGGGLALGEETFEASAGEAVALAHLAGTIGDGEFEDGLGEVNRDRGMLHGGLLLTRNVFG